MKKYRKTNKTEVLKAYYEVENMDVFGKACPVPRELIAYHLKTSKYQVNKYVKELISDGLLMVQEFHIIGEDYDYEYSGYGSRCGMLTPCTVITNKGIELCEQIKEYKQEI